MALRDLDESPKSTSKKAGATSKAILNQKYGNKVCYIIEEVQVESASNTCPGLATPLQGQVKFRCRLELPEFNVVSDVFTRKKDAEQAAANMALEKVGTIFIDNLPVCFHFSVDVVYLCLRMVNGSNKPSNFVPPPVW